MKLNKRRKLHRQDRRRFLRHAGRWVAVPVAALVTGCNSPLPTEPTPSPNPQPPGGVQFSGVASRDMSLADLLREAGHNVNNVVKHSSGNRRFDGLQGNANSQWYIYLNGVRYGDGSRNEVTIDMPAVWVPRGTTWRVEQVTAGAFGFLVAASLLVLGWFWNRKNAIQQSGDVPTGTSSTSEGNALRSLPSSLIHYEY